MKLLLALMVLGQLANAHTRYVKVSNHPCKVDARCVAHGQYDENLGTDDMDCGNLQPEDMICK